MNGTQTAARGRKSGIYGIAAAAVMTAALCVLAPLSIPIGPVPITLATLVIYLAAYALGWRLGALSCLAYVLLGAFGLPVFSGFAGGLGKLLGPTGGYIVGYIPMVVLGGMAIERFSKRPAQLAGLAAGTLVLYALGTAWLCLTAKMALVPALGLAVIPFLPLDAAKLLLAVFIGPVLRDRLAKAKLIE